MEGVGVLGWEVEMEPQSHRELIRSVLCNLYAFEHAWIRAGDFGGELVDDQGLAGADGARACLVQHFGLDAVPIMQLQFFLQL